MAKGHTIPILQLARLLLSRNATVTIFTTPANHPYISTSLSDTSTSIILLPFPKNIPGVPPGVESMDKLPSLSLFFPFVSSTKLMQPDFEKAVQSLKTPVTFMITDGFFGWTLESANKFNIPRLVYYGMSNFAITVNRVMSHNKHLFEGKSNKDLVTVPEFPWLTVTRDEFDDVFNGRDLNSPYAKWIVDNVLATSKSYGLVTNSFSELEPVFEEYWNSKLGPKSWSVGPFCLSHKVTKTEFLSSKKPSWMVWLDKKLQLGSPVLYVAFGSQSEISQDQIDEIKIGLEKSEVSFLWVIRRSENGVHPTLDDGFEGRVKEKGIVVREWVNQREILEHEIVKGFVSHCGWNSVLESICAGVPIVAWPLSAEQPLNAKFVVDEIKIGVRVETCDGSVNGFVKGEGLEKNGGEFAYDQNGLLIRGKPLIFECGQHCSCPPTCRNRVSQNGVKNRLEVFRSRETGWGVRSLDLIQAGSFICEYTGVILTREQAQLFSMNGDNLIYPNRFGERWAEWGDLSQIFSDYVRPSYPSVPPLDFAMDVSRMRNLACYLSHSSCPNVLVQLVLYDHSNISFPHLMLYAMENIPPMRELSLDYGEADELIGKLAICN